MIDDTCSTLYNNSKLASKVQNLKIEDIQDKMIETNYSNIISDYGKIFTPANKYYPSILLKEKEQRVNGTAGTELGLSEQTELINQTSETQANSLEVKNTYWYKTMTTSDFKNGKYYELFINNGNGYDTYWMSSRCIHADSNIANFQVHNVNSGDVDVGTLCISLKRDNSRVFAFRPIITLKLNVQIDTENSRDGSTSEQAYIIK